MDELVIGDKKYISSKQAAKATGYAKDYVGQLCREGRVPARLVGRSWYVLESAVLDHRFGEPKEGVLEETSNENVAPATPVSAWEPPRYAAADVETLPSINRLRTDDIPSEGEEEEGGTQRLQDTWQAWFNTFEDPATHNAVITEEEGTGVEEEEQEEARIEESGDVVVPVHAVRDSHYQSLPTFEEPIPHQQATQPIEQEWNVEQRSISRTGGIFKAVQMVGALFALFVAIAAAFGSGYLDEYAVSSRTVGMIAGVALYNK